MHVCMYVCTYMHTYAHTNELEILNKLSLGCMLSHHVLIRFLFLRGTHSNDIFVLIVDMHIYFDECTGEGVCVLPFAFSSLQEQIMTSLVVVSYWKTCCGKGGGENRRGSEVKH